MSRHEEESIFDKVIKNLKKFAEASNHQIEDRNLQRRIHKDYAFLHLQESFNQLSKEKYGKNYEDLSIFQKVQVLLDSLPSDSQNEAVGKTRIQLEKVRDFLTEMNGERTYWSSQEDKRKIIRILGKKIVEEEKLETTSFLDQQQRSESDHQTKIQERKAQIIAEELKSLLYEEARKELTIEIIAEGTALEFEIESILKNESLSTEEKIQKVREIQELVFQGGNKRKELYLELIEKHKNAVEQEISSILSNPEIDIRDYIDWAEIARREEFKALEDDFKIYLTDVRSIGSIIQKDSEENDGNHSDRMSEILSFKVPEGALDEEKDQILERALEYLDPILDLIEERGEFSHELQFDQNYQDLRTRISLLKTFAFANEPALRMKLEERVNTILALHDVNLGLTKPPFDREKIAIIQRGASDLRIGEIYEEMNRVIAGVNAPIEKVAHYAEQALLEIIHNKPNQRFEQADSVALEQKLRRFVDQLYEGKDIDDQTKARIVRRADRIFSVSLRKALLIARESKLPNDLSRFDNDPMSSIITLWRPSYFLQRKWGTISREEQEIIYETFGGPDGIDQLMSDFNDPYSSGFRVARYLEALNQAGYTQAGLWMRIREPGNTPDVFERRKNAFRLLLQKDTHMLPLLNFYKDDQELRSIISRHGFNTLAQVEERISTALFMKLQIELQNPEMRFDPNQMNYTQRKILEEHERLIADLLSFLKRKEDDIAEKLRLQFKPVDDHELKHSKKHSHNQEDDDFPNYLWGKTVSVADVPTRILEQYEPLVQQSDYWSRIYHGDLGSVYAIREQINYFVRHPQDLEKLADFAAALENQGGREGAQEKVKKIIDALLELNRPTWYAQILPEWLVDLIPGLYANKLQKIRGKNLKAWDLGERLHVMHMLENKGIITPENEHYYKHLLKIRLIDRMIPTTRVVIAFTIGALFLYAVSQAMEELSEKEGSGGH